MTSNRGTVVALAGAALLLALSGTAGPASGTATGRAPSPHPASRFVPVHLPGPDGSDIRTTIRYRGRSYPAQYGLYSVAASARAIVTTADPDGGPPASVVRVVGPRGGVRFVAGRVWGLALTDRSSLLAAWSEYPSLNRSYRHRLVRVVDTRTGRIVAEQRFGDDAYVEAVHGDEVLVATDSGRQWVMSPGRELRRLTTVPDDSFVLDYDARHVVYLGPPEETQGGGQEQGGLVVADLRGRVLRRLPTGYTAALAGDRVAGTRALADDDSSTAYVASIHGGPVTRVTDFRDALALDWLADGRLVVRTLDFGEEEGDPGYERAAVCSGRATVCTRVSDGGLPLIPNDGFWSLIIGEGDRPAAESTAAGRAHAFAAARPSS